MSSDGDGGAMSLRAALLDRACATAPAGAAPRALRDRLWRMLLAAKWRPSLTAERQLENRSRGSDQELLAAFTRGEAEAFDELVDRHLGALVGYASRSLPRDEAEDCAQEACIVLFKKALKGELTPDRNVRAFLFATVRIEVLRKLRARSRQEALDKATAEAASEDEGALAALLRAEQTRRLALALHNACNDQEQEVVLLITDGLNNDEIAAELELQPGHVRVLKHRALKKLRAALAAEVEDAS